MSRVLFPGSFDPVTLAHVDMATRLSAMFDHVIVAVCQNPQKTPRFSLDRRCELFEAALTEGERPANLRIVPWEGLAVDLAVQMGASALVKGVRNATDYEYEGQMAQVNFNLAGLETLLLPASPKLAHVSSSMALHLFAMGAPVEDYLPAAVIAALSGYDRSGRTEVSADLASSAYEGENKNG